MQVKHPAKYFKLKPKVFIQKLLVIKPLQATVPKPYTHRSEL